MDAPRANTTAVFFNFEADFVQSLRCIPLQVRYKLDTCGIKLKLQQWLQFTPAERQQLVTLPCTTATEIRYYRCFLQERVLFYTGVAATDLPVESEPAWEKVDVVPGSVQSKAESLGITLTLEQWRSLTSLQRFALLKLSRAGHENHNFLPALQEFQLV
uniref:Nitrate reductase associated protein n=1 Tax=Cyanothece sp. (strain PCC 7425 / ATCC 29141) TaxID=395961 RepID=B8HRN5_CYAP4